MLRQAVILVGGLGTRLGALTADTPKPMLPIGDRPFLDLLLENFARYGFEEFLLLARHHADRIRAHFDRDHPLHDRISVVEETFPAGTGGALREAASRLDEEFLLANGDSVFDFNYLELLRTFRRSDAIASLALCAVPDVSRYGQVVLNDAGLVTGYAEKSGEAGQPGLISGGVYVMSRKIVHDIPAGQVSLETDVMPGLVDRGRVTGATFSGYFLDIGLPESYAQAQVDLPHWERRKVVFFDRDGTLNRDRGYTHKPEDLTFLPGAPEAIRRCNEAGRLVIVLTNQAGLARGLYTAVELDAFHAELNRQLQAHAAHVDAFYHCPHHVEGTVPDLAISCACRKPGTGMFEQAYAEWKIDLEDAVMIGDKQTDIEAAEAFGIRGMRTDGSDLLPLMDRIGL